MGNQASKAGVKKALKNADQLKTPAKTPNLNRADPINQVDQKVQKQFTYLRQVEKELARQAKKPTPAPVQTQTSWGADPWSKLTPDQQAEREKKAQDIINDKSLAQRLKNVGSIDENMVVSDVKYKDTIEDEVKSLYAQSYSEDGKAAAKMGRVSSADLVNILTNHQMNPHFWTPSQIAQHTRMRAEDVENLTKHYRLLDEDQVYFEFPKEGIRWSEKHQAWFTGQAIAPGDSAAEIADKVKNQKPLLSKTKISLARENVKNFQKIDSKEMSKLKSKYYINDDIYKQINQERDPNDRMLQQMVDSPARYNTNNLIDKLENQYRVQLGERQLKILRQIEAQSEAMEHTGQDAQGQQVDQLLSDIDRFEKTRAKVLKLDKQKGVGRKKHVGRFGDDAGAM